MNQTTTHKIWPQLQKLNLKYDVILEGQMQEITQKEHVSPNYTNRRSTLSERHCFALTLTQFGDQDSSNLARTLITVVSSVKHMQLIFSGGGDYPYFVVTLRNVTSNVAYCIFHIVCFLCMLISEVKDYANNGERSFKERQLLYIH